MGRVDAILLADRGTAGPPVLEAIVLGPSALGFRLHPAIGRWIAAIERALGLADGRPVRIEFGRIVEIDAEIRTDVAIGETAAAAVEQRLRGWLRKIPGSG